MECNDCLMSASFGLGMCPRCEARMLKREKIRAILMKRQGYITGTRLDALVTELVDAT